MRCGIVLIALVALAAGEVYNTEHENLDVTIFSKTEVLQSYLDCFLDKQPCDEVQKSFKVIIAEAIQQACAKCSPTLKYIARVFLKAVQEKLPEGLAEFKNKYDPEDIYFPTLQKSLENSK